jgi:inosose dehydratase
MIIIEDSRTLRDKSKTHTIIPFMPKNKFFTRRDALKMAAVAAAGIPLARAESLAAADAQPAVDHTLPLSLGVAGYTFSSLTIPQVIESLKQVEIDAVTLYKTHAPFSTGTPDECKAAVQKLADAGIKVTSTGVIDITKDEAAARKALDNLKAAGVPMFCARPTVDALPLLDKLVKEYDIKAAIHNHGPTDLYPASSDAWKVIQQYDARIGLCLDVGHAFRAGADPAAEILKCHERLYELHMKDTEVKAGTATKDASPVIVGHGLLDIHGILAALLKVGYQGRVEFEYEKKEDNRLPGLAESAGYIRGMLMAMKS